MNHGFGQDLRICQWTFGFRLEPVSSDEKAAPKIDAHVKSGQK